jgi:glycosyltransferase involved in cell wall biosynthesis
MPSNAGDMKILHLTWTLGIGGAEEMLVDIVNEQCRTERVWVIVINDAVDPLILARIDPAVNVCFLRRKPGSRGLFSLLNLNWLTHVIRPDIIHAHSWSIVKALIYLRCKTVVTVHTTIHTAQDRATFDVSIGRYDRVFAISKAVETDIQQRTAQIRPKLIMNGIRCTEIRSEPRPKDGLFRIAQLARLDHNHKGQDILLKALARIRDQNGGNAVRLDFIGGGMSRQYLENMARDLGLSECVRFRGGVPRPVIYQELCDYDLLVQPSRYEGFGLSVIEAMAARVPVLVSDLEGPREIVDGGRIGFLFRPEDDADCARQIQRIRKLQNDSSLYELVSLAREHVLENFDVRRTAKEYLLEYGRLDGVANTLI